MNTTTADPSTIACIEHLVACIEATAQQLSAALKQYWPAVGNNEIAEANVVVNLAAALSAGGMHVFAEVPFLRRPNEHGDLFASNDKYAVLVEAKRLYHSGKANEVAGDYQRALTSALPSFEGSHAPQPVALVCAVATTWQARIHQYWHPAEARTPRVGAGWRALAEHVFDAPVTERVGSVVIQTCPDWGTQHLLYSIGVRTESFTHGQAASAPRPPIAPGADCVDD